VITAENKNDGANAPGGDLTARQLAETTKARLAAIVECSEDAIIGVDLNGIITDWNRGARNIFGYTAGEIVGTSFRRMIPDSRQEEENFVSEKIGRGENVEQFETQRQTKDGRLIQVSITASPIRDDNGKIIGSSGILRNITSQKEREHEFTRIVRLYDALSRLNHAILWTPTRDQLFQKVCQLLVDHGGFHMVWIGWHNLETREIVPAAVCGDEKDYIRSVKVYADERAEKLGPTGLAFRTGSPWICNDMLHNPITLFWRTELVRNGFQASAVFPIRQKNELCATLSVYADEPWFFQDKEVALLAEAANDISFALDQFATKAARQEVERMAENERLFSTTMIESMPGILYFYDDQGRFLRWNRNFETASGYSGAEIARMHPLDFFSEAEKEPLKHRIAEVFAKGESSIEASLVAKDGSTTPYFFTGRRVMFNGQPCLVGMGVDISERKRAELGLRKAQSEMSAVIENLREGLIIGGPTGELLHWNKAALEMYGFALGSEAHDQFSDLAQIFEVCTLDGRIMSPEQWPFARVLRGESVSGVELRIRRLHGEWSRVFSYDGSFVSYDGDQKLAFLTVQDITRRKQAEEALAASERRYRTTLENMMEGCQLLAFDWRYLYLNETASRHNRRPNAELLGRKMTETWPGIEDTPVFKMLRRCMEERCPLHDEIEFAFSDGQKSWFDVRTQPVPEGIFVLSLDISERKRAAMELSEMQGKLEAVVENLSEGLVIADPGGDFLRWNPASLRMLGFSSPEEGHRHQRGLDKIVELYTLDGARLPVEQWPLGRVRRGEPLDNLEICVRRIGSSWERIFSYTGTLVRYAGDKQLAFMTLRDITERKRAEMALRVLNKTLELQVTERTEELQQALARAEAADRLKSAFLATMSHELRTPLNSIIGFTGIVVQGLAGPLNAEQTKQLGMVRGSARHLLQLINDVLDLSKIEAGQLEVRAEPFELKDALEQVANLVKPLAEKKGLALTIVAPADLGAMMSDRRRVEQILINLLNNAIKFTEQGQVTLTAERLADYQASPTAGPRAAVRLRVSDTGIGIKPEDMAKLFQPFRQINTGITRQHEGTGLGLVICRRLASLLGGEISARSEWAKGSEFTVTLPIQTSATL
jgi:PAS domain S-box-containing protein